MVSVEVPPTRHASTRRRTALVWVYGAWSFLASLLIFWVELMVAKMLLPRFGGSPSVWNTALVFFQINLLAGYAGAHLLAKLDSRMHKLVQTLLVVVPIATLPVALPAFLDSQEMGPTVAVLVSLTLMVGAPFFALSTSTPTLQDWFSHSEHPRARDPYFLYALSNVGSVVGLLGYPLLIERALTLQGQAISWAIGYAIFAALTVLGSRLVGRWGSYRVMVTEAPSMTRRLRWAGVAFIPSLALLGITRHISTDIAAFPLLWTIPLAIYLTSFVVTFRDGGSRWTDAARVALRPLVVLMAVLALQLVPNLLWLTVAVTMLMLGAVSVAGHGIVYEDRPEAGALTHFYMWVSIGGAAGGLFAAILAPVLFDSVLEYTMALALAALLVAGPVRRREMDQRVIGVVAFVALLLAIVVSDAGAKTALLGLAGVIAVLWLNRTWFAGVVAGMLIVTSVATTSAALAQERTFFGVYRVQENEDVRSLSHGTTSHGSQLVSGDRMTPIGYYGETGPVGDVFEVLPEGERDIGIIGLGVGALVAYGNEGDDFTFYEIDPVVEEIARDERFFTLLSNSEAGVDVVIGDGRLELEKGSVTHDLLIMDAFSSDAVPVHLFTVEAFQVYLDSITDDGALLVHISNRHLRLEPIVARIAEELGLHARTRDYSPDPGDEWATRSVWMMLERDPVLTLPETWVESTPGTALWTDDYSNILSVIEWN